MMWCLLCIIIVHPQLMMCSDKLGYIRQPVLSLQLDLSRDGQHERTDFELSKEELHKMISSLEAANKVRIVAFMLCIVICHVKQTRGQICCYAQES